MRRVRRGALAALAWLTVGAASALEPPLPPSPFLLRHPLQRTPPFLDAAPPCLPGVAALPLAELSTRLRARDADGARRALRRAADSPAAAERTHDLLLLAAIVDARAALGAERHSALRELERALERHPDPDARACARLERARLWLALDRAEEAHVELGRARRAGSGRASDTPAARWLAAETAHARGDREEARRLHAALEGDADERLARGATLRLLEHAFPVGVATGGAAAEAASRRFPQALGEAAALGLDVEPFALVGGELALSVGDYGAAHHWLARAERVWPGGLASIRKADALRALGLREEAQRTLERVARIGADADTRALAELRLVDDAIAGEKRDAALGTLARMAEHPHPGLRALARERLTAERLASGDLDGALPAAARLAYDSGPADAAGALAVTVARVIEAGARERDCTRLLERFGGRRELLERSSRGPEALVAVGDCLLELGLAEAALESYRAAGRRFGFDRTPGLALRIAEASLAAGDSDAVAAALAAQAGPRRPGDPAASRWLALAARLALRRERREEAAELFSALLDSEALAPELRAEGERALLVLAQQGVAVEKSRVLLSASLDKPASTPAATRGLTRLSTADLARAGGDPAAAREAYLRAAADLAAGSARDRALHEAAALSAPGEARRDTLAAVDGASAWARLSRLELRLERLREGSVP